MSKPVVLHCARKSPSLFGLARGWCHTVAAPAFAGMTGSWKRRPSGKTNRLYGLWNPGQRIQRPRHYDYDLFCEGSDPGNHVVDGRLVLGLDDLVIFLAAVF